MQGVQRRLHGDVGVRETGTEAAHSAWAPFPDVEICVRKCNPVSPWALLGSPVHPWARLGLPVPPWVFLGLPGRPWGPLPPPTQVEMFVRRCNI